MPRESQVDFNTADSINRVNPFDITCSPPFSSFLRLTGGRTDALLAENIRAALRRRDCATIFSPHVAPVGLLQDVLGLPLGQFSSQHLAQTNVTDEEWAILLETLADDIEIITQSYPTTPEPEQISYLLHPSLPPLHRDGAAPPPPPLPPSSPPPSSDPLVPRLPRGRQRRRRRQEA